MISFLRIPRLTSVLLALVLVAGACGVSREDAGTSPGSADDVEVFGAQSSDPAASIVFADGSEAVVTTGELRAVSRAIASSDQFVALAFNGQLSDQADAQILTQMIGNLIIEHTFEITGGAITDEGLDEARGLVLDDLATGFANLGEADPETVAVAVADELGPYYELMANIRAGIDGLSALAATEEFPCVSHILVESEAEADDLLAQLADGADFAALASEFSTDPGSGANGGALGCESPDTWVPEFRDAVIAAEIGEVVGPIQSDFGYHLIIVTGTEANGDAAAQEALQAELAGTQIEVDESIGSWVDGQIIPAP